ncbi:hypothetical protein VNO77_19970 [Canavalia gladiata]|uniref:Uncharacterized protein n=1 Tax=Canavalia gladiata TaxID=3824 RepID=A0AAN9LPB1_CANGL
MARTETACVHYGKNGGRSTGCEADLMGSENDREMTFREAPEEVSHGNLDPSFSISFSNPPNGFRQPFL